MFNMAPIDDRNYDFEYEFNTDDECKFRSDSGIESDCAAHYQAIDNGENGSGNSTNTSSTGNSGSSSSSSTSSRSSSSSGNDVVKRIEDPLSEPIVRSSLQKIQISSSQLINMSVKDLNKLLSSFPAYVVSKLKRCRRTLKNRGYAKNCRIKRVAAKTELEHVNMKLMIEIRELRQRNRSLLDQLNQLNANNQSVAAVVALGSLTPASDLHQLQQQRHQANQNNEVSTNTNNSQQIINYDTPNLYHEYSHQSQEHHTNLTYTCSSDGNYSQLSEPDLDYIVETINSTDNPTFAYGWQSTLTRQPSLY